MQGYWTANYEEDADAVAPKLAKMGGIAGALYVWLHSRASATGNSIRVSTRFLAERIGVSERGVWNALRKLEDGGIITTEGRIGIGGGTTISLTQLGTLTNEYGDERNRNR